MYINFRKLILYSFFLGLMYFSTLLYLVFDPPPLYLNEVSSAIIQESGPTLGAKQEDILNIIHFHKDNGISQTQILSRLSDEGKTSFQSNVSRDLAKLEERKCIHKLNNSYFPISKNQ